MIDNILNDMLYKFSEGKKIEKREREEFRRIEVVNERWEALSDTYDADLLGLAAAIAHAKVRKPEMDVRAFVEDAYEHLSIEQQMLLLEKPVSDPMPYRGIPLALLARFDAKTVYAATEQLLAG